MRTDIIRIAIADDHPIVVEGISNLLRSRDHFKITATYGSGAGLLEGLSHDVPDVLLLDFYFPDTTAIQLVRVITKKYPELRILAITSSDNAMNVKDMMQNGCSGYILKSAALSVLIEAVETIYKGGQYLQPAIKELLLESMLTPQHKKPADYKLTQREQTILTLLSQGKTNSEIAEQLFVSLRTIENNRLSLYKKLGVRNTAELIKNALQQGLIK